MNRTLKISLIIGGTLIVSGGLFLLGRRIVKKAKEKREEEKRLAEEREKLDELKEGLDNTSTGIGVSPDCSKKDRWIPKRNIDTDIINPFSELKGVKLYVASKSSNPEEGHSFAVGYANVRNSAEVNTKQSTFDISNLIYKHTGSASIGTVVAESYDNQDPKHRWFKIKFPAPKEDCSGYTGGIFGCDKVNYGWVRADTITFKGKDIGWSDKCQIVSHCKGDGSITKSDLKTVLNNEKNKDPRKYKQTCAGVGVDLKLSDIKNNFDGMTEFYDTSYQLGASVFPHSNWQEQYVGMNGQQFELDDELTDL
jgi:hypothetical protein